MLRNTFKSMVKGYKGCGKLACFMPKVCIGMFKEAITDDRGEELFHAVVATPVLFVPLSLLIGVGSLTSAVILTGVGILILPIALPTDMVHYAIKQKHLKRRLKEADKEIEVVDFRLSELANHHQVELPQQNIETVISQQINLPNNSTTTIISALEVPALIPNVEKNSQTIEQLNQYSIYTQQYIDSFKDKPSHTEIIEKLKLTQEENDLLNDFNDDILMQVMDIPVRMNDHQYDLKTLENFLNGKGQDPYTNLKFTHRDIQPARDINEEIEQILEKIQKNRNIINPESVENNNEQIALKK